MTPQTLLAELRSREIELRVDGADLCYRARRGVLTAELKTAMMALKDSLIAIMAQGEGGAHLPVSVATPQPSPSLVDVASDSGRASRCPTASSEGHLPELAWLEGVAGNSTGCNTRRNTEPDFVSNSSVVEMFAEARARLGSWDLEERFVTHMLRRLTPAVAALWPNAPLDASWFDWRLKLGPEHVPGLDAALEALHPASAAPSPELPAPSRPRRSKSSKCNRST